MIKPRHYLRGYKLLGDVMHYHIISHWGMSSISGVSLSAYSSWSVEWQASWGGHEAPNEPGPRAPIKRHLLNTDSSKLRLQYRTALTPLGPLSRNHLPGNAVSLLAEPRFNHTRMNLLGFGLVKIELVWLRRGNMAIWDSDSFVGKAFRSASDIPNNWKSLPYYPPLP